LPDEFNGVASGSFVSWMLCDLVYRQIRFDGFNQARVIVSSARNIDPCRDRPHAQYIVRRGSQEFNTGLSGKPSIMILTLEQDRHAVMNFPHEVIGGGYDQCGASKSPRPFQGISTDPRG
jgi:hypothetical protein